MSEQSLSGDWTDGDASWGGLDAPRWRPTPKHISPERLEEILSAMEDRIKAEKEARYERAINKTD
jgi:hypothetical protein